MMTLLRANETWQGYLEATATWVHPAAKEFGEATVIIPRGHPALAVSSTGDPLYIDEDGGFYVELSDADLGVWRGIADVPRINAERVEIPCIALEALTSIRRVSNATYAYCVPAGAIVEAGYKDAFGSMGTLGIGLGAIDYGGPLILGYDFAGKYFSDLLADMMTFTGMEWWIDDAGNFNWGGFGGRYYPYPLADSGDVVDGERDGTIREMAVEVTAVNNLGMELTRQAVLSRQAAMWPRQVVVDSNG